MPGKKRLCALAALAASVAALGGCGGSDVSGSLTQDQAQPLLDQLDGIQAAAAQGHCQTAQAKAQDFLSAVDGLPSDTGTELKDALRTAGKNLVTLAQDPSQCKPSGATGLSGQQTTSSTTTSVPTTTATTTPEETTTSTAEEPPPSEGGNGQGNGGGPPAGGDGGGPPSPPPSGGGGGVGPGTGGTGGTGD